jgi:nucleotide-binding universal stress UspA family protein
MGNNLSRQRTTMYETILVPLDGSLLAERALTAANGLASAVGGRIILVRVLPDNRGKAEAGASPDAVTRPEIETYLAQTTKRLTASAVETVVAGGDPAQTILAHVSERGVDLIVMSTHGRSGVGRWIFGSVADEVMRHAPVPVLLVSSTSPEKAWPKGRPLRILVTLDYSPLAETVLAAATDLAKASRRELTLLSVTPLIVATYELGQVYLPYDVDQDLIDRRNYLEQTAANLRTLGCTVTTRVEFGDPRSLIVDVARAEDVDLIAMATHGSRGVTRILIGSVATGVIQRATAPVLVVRPAEVRAEKADVVASGTVNRGASH